MALKTWDQDKDFGIPVAIQKIGSAEQKDYPFDFQTQESTTSERGRNIFRIIQQLKRDGHNQMANVKWGHHFASTKTVVDESSLRLYNLENKMPGNQNAMYRGLILTMNRNRLLEFSENEPSLDDTRDLLFMAGSTAIAKTIPTKSALDLGTTLGELRMEGLPSLPGVQRDIRRIQDLPKGVGSEILNFEFSWKPLISDILGIVKVAAESERILEQYRRESGRQIRRRYEFPDEKETTTFNSDVRTSPYPIINYYNCSPAGGVYRTFGMLGGTVQRTSRTWFSGSYRYHIPEYKGLRGDIAKWEREANRLLGLSPTPELFWNLTKWSWLVDWFSNFGDVLTNISYLGRDNLVLHYGYMMRETTLRVESELHGFNPMTGGIALPSPKTNFSWNRKVRYAASPYGFGLDPGVFTPRQWTILAALGATKAPGILH